MDIEVKEADIVQSVFHEDGFEILHNGASRGKVAGKHVCEALKLLNLADYTVFAGAHDVAKDLMPKFK